ncbi:hypothetical protein GCM10023115_41820 [Pontixanthobacter gangjinensis]|uniref:IPT/TIG domain-containing protein n=1 Tax=Christiangramia aestuarii TaxID=1028746 RepID=A0A7M3SYP6_9FLAO|nr:IPT/TIG domain-containing protein [Christiangramia aestuarii]MUP41727.1 hypothetical protein [Christiangramia aestuarii]
MKFYKYLLLSLSFTLFLNSCTKDSDPEESEEEISQEPQPEPNPSLSISRFTPNKADLGDTISIKGENFSRNFELLMNEMPLKVIFSNDSVIKFEVPYNNFNPFNFKVILNDQEAESIVFENPFELYEPQIDSVSSKIGFRDKAVIYGSHLTNSPNKTRDIVYLNNEMVETEFQSKDSIIFDLKFLYLTEYENDLLVQAQLQEVRLNKGLKIMPPKLEGINKDQIKVGDTLQIHGKYFRYGTPDWHKVYIDGARAKVLDGNEDTLWIEMPMGPYGNRNISEVRLSLFSKETATSIDLHLNDTWYLYDVLKKQEVTNSGYAGNITPYSFNNSDYIYLNSFTKQDNSNFMNTKLLQYDPLTKELIDLAEIPIEFDNYFGYHLQLFPAENPTELFLYLSRAEDNFYRYDYQTGELSQLKDFPGPDISEGTGAILDNKFYFGLGHTGSNSLTANHTMYEYNFESDEWNLHSEMPFESERAVNSRKTDFVWNNSLFTGNGSDMQYDFWKFSPSEGWIKKESIPNPISSFAYFQTGDKAFYYHQYDNEFWEYQRNTNSWNNRADLAVGKYGFSPESAFVIGDYVYFIGYFRGYGYEESAAIRNDQLILRTEVTKP